MDFIYSNHWLRKRKYRKTITETDIEYAILNSNILKDKRWEDVFNVICRVPPSGYYIFCHHQKVYKL